MHWGTFLLTDEPPLKLKEALKKYNRTQDEFITLKIGESLEV
jgi:L-ascorbate metabolism protein UlaG (beta-lactamase superfamily)